MQNYIPLCFALITIGFFIGWDMRLEDVGEEKPQSSATEWTCMVSASEVSFNSPRAGSDKLNE